MIELKLSKYNPVNDIYLLETDTPKIKNEAYDATSSGILIAKKSVVESRKIIGKIVKKGPKCSDDFQIGDIINYYPDAGLDIVFVDSDKKHILIGAEKFLGVISDCIYK